MSRVKNLILTLFLLLTIVVLVLSVLIYHVSAVSIVQKHHQTQFLETIESKYSIQDCTWISETVIETKVITVQCESAVMGVRILHFDEKGTVLAGLDLDQVHYPMAKEAFKALTGIPDFTITLTFYHEDSVYWIQSGTTEWLMSLQDHKILWKVEKQ